MTTKTTKVVKSLSHFVVFVVFVVENQIRNEENFVYSVLVIHRKKALHTKLDY